MPSPRACQPPLERVAHINPPQVLRAALGCRLHAALEAAADPPLPRLLLVVQANAQLGELPQDLIGGCKAPLIARDVALSELRHDLGFVNESELSKGVASRGDALPPAEGDGEGGGCVIGHSRDLAEKDPTSDDKHGPSMPLERSHMKVSQDIRAHERIRRRWETPARERMRQPKRPVGAAGRCGLGIHRARHLF